MRKLILLLIVALSSTMMLKAQTTYSIRIGDVAVTSQNANDVLGDGGSIKYNATDKILTLNNASPAESTNGINTTEENLTIEVLGTNTISGTSNAIKAANCKKIAIKGDGTLKLAGQYAINLLNTDLSINNTNLSITCSDIGINTASNDNVVEISESNVSIISIRKTKKIVPFGQFGNVTLSDCKIISPKGATYDTGKKAIVVADTIYQGNLGIQKEIVFCRFTGNDLDVTVSNIGLNDSINLINTKMLKSGSIAIDTTTRTMYFEDVLPKNGLYISLYAGGYTIDLTGVNNISHLYFDIKDGKKEAWIKGSGELSLLGGIDCKHTYLEIKDCKVTVNTFEYEFVGLCGKEDAQLTINKAEVKIILGSEYDPVTGFDEFTLTDCEITSHEGVTYDKTKKVLVDGNNKNLKSTVTIEPVKEIEYCAFSNGAGTTIALTNLHYDTELINSKFFESGNITFDAENKVLHLNNVSPKESFNVYVQCDMDIDLIGENNISYITYHNLDSKHINATIYGDGELTVDYDINCYYTDLKIEECKVTVNSDTHGNGIRGEEGVSTLTISNAEVTVSQTPGYKPIYDFDDVILKDCAITSHEGATYDKTKKALVDKDGNEITTTVTIEPVEEIVYCIFYMDLDGDGVFGDEMIEVKNTNIASALNRVNNEFIESGTITFDETNRILHLNNVSEQAACMLEIDTDMDIDLIGENQLSSLMSYNEATTPMNVTISGEGELAVKYQIGFDANLEIKDCKVTVNTEHIGNGGVSGNAESILTINNAEFTVIQTADILPIADFYDVILTMCEVTSHEGATYDKTNMTFVDKDGNEIRTTITIAPKKIEDTGNYFMFCGTNLVTKDNCSDLSALCPAGTLKSGSISFVPETRTLVFDNVDFEATSALNLELPCFMLLSSEFSSPIFEAGIQIEVIGNNKISCGNNMVFIGMEYLFTFTGGGTLDIYSEAISEVLPVTVASLAVVDETTVNIHTGQLSSIFFTGSHSTLTVDKSNLNLYGGGAELGGEKLPTVVALTAVKLIDCEVTCSTGAASFDSSKMNFVDAEGNIVMDGIFISSTYTGIENVIADKNAATKIIRDGQLLIIRDGKQYNALGQLMN